MWQKQTELEFFTNFSKKKPAEIVFQTEKYATTIVILTIDLALTESFTESTVKGQKICT